MAERLAALLDAFRSLEILVVGDLMLDEYLWGDMERISPEAPVPVVELSRADRVVGGAGNVVRNAHHLGATVRIVGVVGEDPNARLVREELACMASTDAVLADPGRPTSVKTRILARGKHILRLDHESRRDIDAELQERICDALARCPRPGAVVLSDYGKGLLTERVLATALDLAKQWGVPSVVDPKGDDYRKYRGCTVITPNKKEAEQASGRRLTDPESYARAARDLRFVTRATGIVITRGSEGMSVIGDSIVDIATEAREVYDVTGAGDTVCSVIALGLAAGLSLVDAARLANTAAGIVVEKVGTSWVSPRELLHRSAETPASKIQDRDQLRLTCSRLKSLGKRIVFTNGCFDLLHVGHLKYLAAARAKGDVLVVGLNADSSVRSLKGEKRPLLPETQRAAILAGLESVDFVTLFEELTPEALIEAVMPDVLVKGGDYTVDGVLGREIVERGGGRVEIVPLEPGSSTTSIVQTILDRYAERGERT